MSDKREYYPENRSDNDDLLYYVEFHQWEGEDETWTLFKRQFLSSKEEHAKELEKMSPSWQRIFSREAHPWNLGGGKVCKYENAVSLDTKEFLRFMVDSLNKNK